MLKDIPDPPDSVRRRGSALRQWGRQRHDRKGSLASPCVIRWLDGWWLTPFSSAVSRNPLCLSHLSAAPP